MRVCIHFSFIVSLCCYLVINADLLCCGWLGYTLSYTEKADADSRNTITTRLASTIQNYTINGLRPTTVYTVQLYASTRVGTGPSRSHDVQTARTPGMLLCTSLVVTHTHVYIYTVGHKKRGTLLLSMSSPIIDQFSKFFHWYTLQTICNSMIIIYLTTR